MVAISYDTSLVSSGITFTQKYLYALLAIQIHAMKTYKKLLFVFEICIKSQEKKLAKYNIQVPRHEVTFLETEPSKGARQSHIFSVIHDHVLKVYSFYIRRLGVRSLCTIKPFLNQDLMDQKSGL